MKSINTICKYLAGATAFLSLGACSYYLDKEPMSSITPEKYYSSAAQINAILLDEYPNTLGGFSNWSYGTYGDDKGTDNQVGESVSNVFTPDLYKVPNSGGNFDFKRLYYINFTLSNVLPRFGDSLDGSQSTIDGDPQLVRHYVGEAYFLRAWWYFKKLKEFGDYAIITEPLPDDMTVLQEAAKRSPRNEVARFILSDLDKAITLMDGKDLGSNRINRDLAIAFKSTVALFEGSWEANFKGTAFVPGGAEWTGAQAWPDYKYPSGSADSEVKFFLSEAVKAAKEVGDKYVGALTDNTGVFQQSASDPKNPYFEMFADEDMSGYKEIMLWRQYGRGLSTHNVCAAASRGNQRIGVTRGFVQNFLMADGTPVYAHGDYADGDGYYMGDKTIADVRKNRDSRLSVFLKEPGQKNILYEVDNTEGTEAVIEEPYPLIFTGDAERGYVTGYALHKGGNFNRKYYANGGAYTGAPIYRAVEPLLNYIEASYLLNGNIDATAELYWKAIRRRAGINEDFRATIAATDMQKEAENDWAAYTAGRLVDPTMYNIRRERRSEFLSEGKRMDDLHRWRAMDQLISEPYHIEGFHLWNTPITSWYDSANLTYNVGTSSTVSDPARSEYLRPFEKYPEQNAYNGCTWRMAHYLSPIPITEILLASPSGHSVTDSYLYQNPYWPLEADKSAEK